ncbi:DNA damage-regulated autophagy modulator protein 1 [Hydra vulgaris]|uniref:DNA damage-regulated autophagy modulator protein 1 n=1 Tax=Hydra vulgaris TaxID=6087 RepID=UPI001F5ECC89|nr:DNA damage-regulated autophagy modulator protein 1 [Hydra vulgaris]
MVEENDGKKTFKSLHLIVIASVLLPVFTLCISYIVGFKLEKINPSFVPFVSDTGDTRPHSSIFTFGLSLSGVLTLVIITIRYYQVEYILLEAKTQSSWINQFSLVSGLTLVFGEFIVAAFQISNVKSVHFIGAGMHFGGAALFCATQCYFTYKSSKKKCQITFVVRVVSTAIMTASSIVFSVFMIPSLNKYNRKGGSVGQIFEWLLVSTQLIFMLTFLKEFRELEIEFRLSKINNLQDTSEESKKLVNIASFTFSKTYQRID